MEKILFSVEHDKAAIQRAEDFAKMAETIWQQHGHQLAGQLDDEQIELLNWGVANGLKYAFNAVFAWAEQQVQYVNETAAWELQQGNDNKAKIAAGAARGFQRVAEECKTGTFKTYRGG